MNVPARVRALEKRSSPTGECACGASRSPALLLCRDPSVPPPPAPVCSRCARPVRRLILGPVPWAKGERAYEPLTGLRDFYERTVRPAYEPATIDTVLTMMAPPEGCP